MSLRLKPVTLRLCACLWLRGPQAPPFLTGPGCSSQRAPGWKCGHGHGWEARLLGHAQQSLSPSSTQARRELSRLGAAWPGGRRASNLPGFQAAPGQEPRQCDSMTPCR